MTLSTIDLRLFAAIADSGGITAAATRLGLTKSMVSRELAAMEDRLGARLVQRTTRKVSLTETGELLAIYARRVVEELESAEAAIDATRDAPRGDLKITAPFSVLRFIVSPRLGEFRARYPDIRLNIDASMRIADLVEEGVDVALRIGELPPSSLVARRLATIPVVLVAAPSYLAGRSAILTPGDLLAHDVVNLRKDLSSEVWTLHSEHGTSEPIGVRPVASVHDPGILLDLATQGLGVAPMPLLYARASLERGDLVRVLPAWRQREAPLHAVYPSRRSLAPKVRAFIEFAAEILGDVA